MSQLLYFAYGSNMHPQRLRQRVPSSQALGQATLLGYSLRFHKAGRDDSGKCDAYYTGQSGAQLHGVVYRLRAAEKPLLDAAEGLGQGYNVAYARVAVTGQTSAETFFYTADPEYIDSQLVPYDWYHQLVLTGAQHHGLPHDYIAMLAHIKTKPDPDQERNALHQRILDS